jgi:hypothetical protein
MCAEAVWWRCHRRIITDYLLAAGEQVMHILGKSHVDVANLTPGAVVRNDGTVVYPAQDTQQEWGKELSVAGLRQHADFPDLRRMSHSLILQAAREQSATRHVKQFKRTNRA